MDGYLSAVRQELVLNHGSGAFDIQECGMQRAWTAAGVSTGVSALRRAQRLRGSTGLEGPCHPPTAVTHYLLLVNAQALQCVSFSGAAHVVLPTSTSDCNQVFGMRMCQFACGTLPPRFGDLITAYHKVLNEES